MKSRTHIVALRRVLLLLVLVWALMYFGFLGREKKQVLEELRRAGEIVFLTLNAPSTLYETRDGEFAGIEFDLGTDFAKFLGVKSRFVIFDDLEALFTQLKEGGNVIGAAGLTVTAERSASFVVGPSYQKLFHQVVCHRRGHVPRDLNQLPKFQMVVTAGFESLLESTSRNPAQCLLTESNVFELHRRYFPDLEVVGTLGSAQEVAWMMPKTAEGLAEVVGDWMEDLRRRDRLSFYLHRNMQLYDKFDREDIQSFSRSLVSVLPQYLSFFKEAGKRHDIAWQLLAAISYQESHWDPYAVSPRGARGMMMLMEDTALDLGVEDRADPKQSILGGAQYLKQLYRRLPQKIDSKNRMWLAMAAYNVGWGHLMDAHKLGFRLGRTDLAWNTIRDLLPLLSEEQYYRDLEFGYARGQEPVHFVQKIETYRRLIEKSNLR